MVVVENQGHQLLHSGEEMNCDKIPLAQRVSAQEEEQWLPNPCYLRSGTWGGCTRGGGGVDIPCRGEYESTNSGTTKSVPLLKNERTNYVWFPIIAHEKQWALAVITGTNP